ncbi:MAG: MerR family transcriptional regulator [Deltaproteobacteria bacterium]|nr:MerR family transcriptional regulator [Deltaproteobacteria bacterium]
MPPRKSPVSPADSSPASRPPAGLVKASELARRSGVPAATIKHYVREGLIEPARTSRNMAYYDPALVPRVERIKELQRTRFLPLRVIKSVLEEEETESEDEKVAAAIARMLVQTAPAATRSRDELIASGVPVEQLDWLESMGIVTSNQDAGVRVYAGDDLEILRVLGAARRAGITADMLPVTMLAEYGEALRNLVRTELRLYREGVLPRAPTADISALTEAATTLSERLVVLLRRKMLVPTLRALSPGRVSRPKPARRPRASREA